MSGRSEASMSRTGCALAMWYRQTVLLGLHMSWCNQKGEKALETSALTLMIFSCQKMPLHNRIGVKNKKEEELHISLIP